MLRNASDALGDATMFYFNGFANIWRALFGERSEKKNRGEDDWLSLLFGFLTQTFWTALFLAVILAPHFYREYCRRQEAIAREQKANREKAARDGIEASERDRRFRAEEEERAFIMNIPREPNIRVRPVRVEKVLRRHPAVADAVVVPVLSKRYGEEPMALVVLRSDFRIAARDLVVWTNKKYTESYDDAINLLTDVAFVERIPRDRDKKIDVVEVAKMSRKTWGR